jgi:hypothetical protein
VLIIGDFQSGFAFLLKKSALKSREMALYCYIFNSNLRELPRIITDLPELR